MSTAAPNLSPQRARGWAAWTSTVVVLALAGCAALAPPEPTPANALPAAAEATLEAAPRSVACPTGLPADARCLGGTDRAGAHYLIALPAGWTSASGTLVLHAHGGPTLGPARPERAVEDLQRWSIWVRAGHAYAGSTFAEGGVQVRAAAVDTERLRRVFVRHIGQPRTTILHGQSWGAGVALKGAQMFASDRNTKPVYDAVLLTSGVVGGGTRSYDFRLDLRVIYQHLCNNHPRPSEPPYPLWMGLPAGSTMTQADLAARARECLGTGLPARERSPEQARRLKVIVDVLKIPESSVQGHLNWATFHFADVAHQRTGGRPVFGNIGAVYRGSGMDDELNRSVARYATNPAAVRAFALDTDFNARIHLPMLGVHGIMDAVAFVELQHQLREVMRQQGSADNLVQTFADFSEHSYMHDVVYVTLLDRLLNWVATGQKTDPAAVHQRCLELAAQWGQGGTSGCRFKPGYFPEALDTRVTPRQRP
jgi:hypothetical protein